MVAITPSPSPFATLLRRSKFSSFDPHIAQVFASYDGDAHRGNWGFKRPLAIRHRRSHITVKAVDTSSQQTEWSGAGNQVKFMRKWEELNTEMRRKDSQRHNGFDSEFSPREEEADKLHLQPVRNVLSMKPTEFQTYLKQLRALRPEFAQFLRNEQATRTQGKSMYELAQQRDTNFHGEFIATQAARDAESMESRHINKMVHRTGGLTYSRPSRLQTFLTTKPQPGRVVQLGLNGHRSERGRQTNSAYVVAFGGMTHTLWRKDAPGVKMVKWSEPASTERGIAQFRLTSARYRAAPTVVGKRQGVKAVKMRGYVQSERTGFIAERSNNYAPGTPAYVGALKSQVVTGLKAGKYAGVANFDNPPQKMTGWKPQPTAGGTQSVLQTLSSIISGGR